MTESPVYSSTRQCHSLPRSLPKWRSENNLQNSPPPQMCGSGCISTRMERMFYRNIKEEATLNRHNRITNLISINASQLFVVRLKETSHQTLPALGHTHLRLLLADLTNNRPTWLRARATAENDNNWSFSFNRKTQIGGRAEDKTCDDATWQ